MRTRIAIATTLAAAALSAAPAHAQSGGGTTSLQLDSVLARTLSMAGTDGAASFDGRAALAVITARVTSGRWRVAHRGTLTLRAHGGALKLDEIEVRLDRRVRVLARVAGRERTILTSAAHPERLTRHVVLRAAAVLPTVPFAALVRRRLGIALPTRTGTLDVDARTSAGTVTAVKLPPRPAGAVDVTSATVEWHIRDSFVQYLNAGEGIAARDGAQAGPATVRPGSDQPLVYDMGLPLRRGWHDAATGLTLLELGGTVAFRYRAHGIDLSVRDAVLELRGGRPSRATFVFGGDAAQEYKGKRAPLVDLDPARAAGHTTSDDGRTETYSEIPGAVPQSTTPLSGFYAAGDPFGWITVTFTKKLSQDRR